MDFSVVIISFYSFHLIENLINNFDLNTNIIIIENSRDNDLKKKIEAKYKNVQVILPDTNLGWGSGVNIGLKMLNDNHVLCVNPDVQFKKNTIYELIECAKNLKNFTILSPTYLNSEIYKNYDIYSNKKTLEGEIFKKYEIKEVDYVDGQFILINKKKLENIGYMDEKIFLHYETKDLCKRIIDKNEKVFVCEKIKYDHMGQQSTHPKAIDYSMSLRNWHYCWSKFYFFRKHYSYLFALRKTYPNFVRSIKNCFIAMLARDKLKFNVHKHELLGLLNSYFLRKSFLRPKIKKNL